jgi:hypothetical protein
MRPSRLGTEGCDTTNSGFDEPRCSILNCGQRFVLDQFAGAAHAAPTKWLPAFTVELELEADLCTTSDLRSADDLRRAPTRQPHLRPRTCRGYGHLHGIRRFGVVTRATDLQRM